LLTSITEPADAPGNPPAVTTLDYYLHRQGEPWGPRGAVKEVIDPNGVWTGFEYDQWGQQAAYREGKYASAVASGDQYVYVLDTPQDSAGNTTGNDSSGGGGGSSTHDSTGNETSNTCMWRAALQAPGSGPNWFPFALPCNPPNLPERSAEFFSATYSPKGELQVLPLHLGVGTRTHTRTYDVMGRPLSVSVESNEAGGAAVTRTFTHAYDVPNGRYTRTGPDGVETFVQLDAANRVQFVRRGAEGAPLMTATYTYQANGFVDHVTYGNGTVVQYAYEGHRLASIEHLRAPGTGERLLRLDYEYDARDLPWRITEYGAGPVSTPTVQAVTTFAYDRRGRVTGEARMYFPDPSDATQNYYLEYGYDAGGNRTVKIDHYNLRRVEYHYDVDADADPAVYASRNNRLMWYETIDTAPNPEVTLSKTYYVYAYDSTDERRAGKSDGNVTRIITEHVAESAASGTEAGQRGLRGGDRPAFKAREAHDERAGDWSAGSTAAACGAGETRYTAVRLGYAANGRAVTFIHDESWCWDQVSSCPVTSSYKINWAREFRYDGARARYMNRQLDPAGLLLNPPVYTPLSTIWSDYDGDEIYSDFEMVSGSAVNKRSFEPGIGRTANPLTTPVTDYYHSDQIGTTRLMSNPNGGAIEPAVYTAFGEQMSAPGVTDATRYGYVGAWDYEQNADFPFLHVGARYYDPSSGRFLQRDPIGLVGGTNVYAYLDGAPTDDIDPEGLQRGVRPGGIPTVRPPGRADRPGWRPPVNDIPNTPVSEMPPGGEGRLINGVMNCSGGNFVGAPPPPPCSCGQPPYDGHHLHPAPPTPPTSGPCGSGGDPGGGAAGSLIALIALRWRRKSAKCCCR
jgi:RHS repeat-associated protein